MTEKQYDKIWHIVKNEIDEFRESFKSKSGEEVYDEYYKISAYEEIYDFICCEAINLKYKGFPPKNILQDFYNQFMDTSYDLTQESLHYFFEDQIEENIKYKRFDSEM